MNVVQSMGMQPWKMHFSLFPIQLIAVYSSLNFFSLFNSRLAPFPLWRGVFTIGVCSHTRPVSLHFVCVFFSFASLFLRTRLFYYFSSFFLLSHSLMDNTYHTYAHICETHAHISHVYYVLYGFVHAVNFTLLLLLVLFRGEEQTMTGTILFVCVYMTMPLNTVPLTFVTVVNGVRPHKNKCKYILSVIRWAIYSDVTANERV